MNEMRKLMEAVSKIEEANGPRDATISVMQLMDEGMLTAQQVADAALSYLSDSEVADMASRNEWFGDEDEDEYDESVQEAYDEEVDGETSYSNDGDTLRMIIRDLQKLERDTARVYREATQSKGRADYADMLLNELGYTLTDISDLVEKYENATE